MTDHPPFSTLTHYRLRELLGRGAIGEGERVGPGSQRQAGARRSTIALT